MFAFPIVLVLSAVSSLIGRSDLVSQDELVHFRIYDQELIDYIENVVRKIRDDSFNITRKERSNNEDNIDSKISQKSPPEDNINSRKSPNYNFPIPVRSLPSHRVGKLMDYLSPLKNIDLNKRWPTLKPTTTPSPSTEPAKKDQPLNPWKTLAGLQKQNSKPFDVSLSNVLAILLQLFFHAISNSYLQRNEGSKFPTALFSKLLG